LCFSLSFFLCNLFTYFVFLRCRLFLLLFLYLCLRCLVFDGRHFFSRLGLVFFPPWVRFFVWALNGRASFFRPSPPVINEPLAFVALAEFPLPAFSRFRLFFRTLFSISSNPFPVLFQFPAVQTYESVRPAESNSPPPLLALCNPFFFSGSGACSLCAASFGSFCHLFLWRFFPDNPLPCLTLSGG